MFPKGSRYNSVDYTDIRNTNPVSYVPADSRVLVNTPCALHGFFHQSTNHACDVFGNVSIPIVARIGRFAPEPFYGGLSAQQSDRDWRSDEAKNCAAEDRRLVLEQQQFADADQKLMIRKKMKAIQNKAENAVQAHQASMTEYQLDTDIEITVDAQSMIDDTGIEREMEESLIHVGFNKASKDNDGLLEDDDLISVGFNTKISEEE